MLSVAPLVTWDMFGCSYVYQGNPKCSREGNTHTTNIRIIEPAGRLDNESTLWASDTLIVFKHLSQKIPS